MQGGQRKQRWRCDILNNPGKTDSSVICDICGIWIFSLLSFHHVSEMATQEGRGAAVVPKASLLSLLGGICNHFCFPFCSPRWILTLLSLHSLLSLHTALVSSVPGIIFPSCFCSFQYLLISPPKPPHSIHVYSSLLLGFLSALFTSSPVPKQPQKPLPFPQWEATWLSALTIFSF